MTSPKHKKRGTTPRLRERVLIEFPVTLLARADHAAQKLNKKRSDFIRTAVERLLDGLEKEQLDADLAAAYQANAQRNLELIEEFSHVDREIF